MGLLKNMDLYKAIILLSIVLIPAACFFVYWVENETEEAEKAIAQAERRNGQLEQIGLILKQLQLIRQNTARSGLGDSHRIYFERRILAAAERGLKVENFQISNQVRRGAGRSAQDQEVTITFKHEGKDVAWPRDFISAMVYNCESGSKAWRLRQLSLRNEEILELGRGKKTPPKTVDDTWRIEKLLFARREPAERRR